MLARELQGHVGDDAGYDLGSSDIAIGRSPRGEGHGSCYSSGCGAGSSELLKDGVGSKSVDGGSPGNSGSGGDVSGVGVSSYGEGDRHISRECGLHSVDSEGASSGAVVVAGGVEVAVARGGGRP